MEPRYDILIVGAGHGGAQAAASLRQRGFTGTVAVVGEEPDPPYERPALSKEYLAGERSFERLLIRPTAFWEEQGVDILTGRCVSEVLPNKRRVILANGAAINYGTLIWAAGGSPRRLTCSGHDLAGVHSVRSRSDVDRLLDELGTTERIVVIGGGYIGLEAAAVLSKMGKHIVVLEAQERVLARVAGSHLSRFYEAEHRAHGVDIRLGASVVCIEEQDGRASGVKLADGATIPAEMVIVGIGITPAVQPLLAAGASGGNGVSVDAGCRTSLPDVYAIGDCALHANKYARGAEMRVESVQNANDQASLVAKLLTGGEGTYDSVPWFWSNQYDLRLQTVGISVGHDIALLRGDMSARSFSIIYLKNGCVIALDCVNASRDYVQGRSLISSGVIIAPAALSDVSIPLKVHAPAAPSPSVRQKGSS